MKSSRHDGDFAHSMTDLMAGVAVTFLLIAAIFMVQSSQDKKRAQQAKLRAEELARDYKLAAMKFDQLDKRDSDAIHELEKLKTELADNPHLRGNVELEYDPRRDPRLLTVVFSRKNLSFASGQCEVEATQRAGLKATLHEIFPLVCAAVGTGLVDGHVIP